VKACAVLLLVVVAAALFAPWLAPNDPARRFNDLLYAPPTRVHLAGGGYIHPLELVSRRERRFEPDHARTVPLRWFHDGRLVTAEPEGGAPLLLLGADGYGRDIFARLLHGARTTLLLAVLATLGATVLGAVLGGISGQAAGWVDAVLSRISEFVLVLPAIYVALALRAVMPLVLDAATVFALLTAILTLLGWPVVARGVRAIVLAERERDYASAARAAGAGDARLLLRHLLPAATGYITTQATLLFPAFILAEATLSFVGLGFPQEVATWGPMLQEAANVATLGDTPWTLAPAAAIFAVVLGVNLVVQGSGRAPIQLEQ
jgi:peptide/nickel transport system permease protein